MPACPATVLDTTIRRHRVRAHKTIAAASSSESTVRRVQSGSLRAVVISLGIAASVEFGVLHRKHNFESMMLVGTVAGNRILWVRRLLIRGFGIRRLGTVVVGRTLGIDCIDYFALRRSDSGERPSTGAVSVPQLLRRTVTELPLALGQASVGVGSVACCEVLPASFQVVCRLLAPVGCYSELRRLV